LLQLPTSEAADLYSHSNTLNYLQIWHPSPTTIPHQLPRIPVPYQQECSTLWEKCIPTPTPVSSSREHTYQCIQYWTRSCTDYFIP